MESERRRFRGVCKKESGKMKVLKITFVQKIILYII